MMKRSWEAKHSTLLKRNRALRRRILSLEYLLHCIRSAPGTNKITVWAINKVMEE